MKIHLTANRLNLCPPNTMANRKPYTIAFAFGRRVTGTLTLLFAVASCLFLVGCSNHEADAAAVRIGVILNLTGDAAKADASKKEALELANEFLRLKRPRDKHTFNLIFEDGKSSAKDSLTAYNNLSRQGIRIMLIGSSLSAMPVCPRVRANGDLLFAVSGHPDLTSAAGQGIRLYPNVDQGSSIIATKIIPRGVQSVYILHMEEPWTKSYYDSIRRKLSDRVEVIEDTYPVGNQNFKDIVARIKIKQPERIVILDFGMSMDAIMRTLIENKVSIPVIGCENTVNANIPALEGFEGYDFAFLATEYIERVQAGTDEYANYFKEHHKGAFPPYYAVFCAEGLKILADTLAEDPQSGNDPKALFAAILKKKTFDGFSGPLLVQSQGDIDFPLNVYRYKDQKLMRQD